MSLQPAPQVGKLNRLEAVRLGVSRNLKLLREKTERDRVVSALTATRRAYVPRLVFAVDYKDATPAESNLASDRERRLDYSASVNWASPIGTNLSLSTQMDQNVTGNEQPEHVGLVELSLSQSLLKNGWSVGAGTPLLEAELDVRIQQEALRLHLNDLLVKLESAYWELAVAQADLAIKVRSMKGAQEQYDDTRENIRRGILASAEIYVVEENRVYFEQALLQAEQRLILARRVLAELLVLGPDTPIEAIDSLDQVASRVVTSTEAYQKALQTNPELRIKVLQLERSRLHLALAENQALPKLDLQASLTLVGKNNDLGLMWERALTGKGPEAKVGVLFEIPLDPRPAEAQVIGRRATVRQEELALAESNEKVRFQIENLVTTLQVQAKQLGLAEQLLKLADLKLEAQLAKYRNGASTLADVVRFQRDLDKARISLCQAQLSLWVNQSRLLAAQGDLHQILGVEVR